MELKVFKDSFLTAQKPWEGKIELPIDTEILLPDYLPQIFKIVKCLFGLVVLQKNISGNRLLLEGYLRCLVWYQAENGTELCQTEQKLPFERTAELPDDSFSGGKATVFGSVEYLNCRAINQRRIEVRGGYSLQFRVQGGTKSELITALAGCGVEQDLEKIQFVQNIANLDKLMTNEEEVTLPEGLGSILDVSGVGEIREQKLLGGKAVLKGRTLIQITYTQPQQDQLMTFSAQVPFNQIVDIDGLTESCKCLASAETIGCLVESGSDGASTLTVTSMLHIAVYSSGETAAVRDAFSTQYETEAAYREVFFTQTQDDVQAQVQTTATIALPDAEARQVGCLATLGPLSMRDTEEGCRIAGTAQIHLLYKNALGEVGCSDAEAKFELPKRYPGKGEDYVMDGWAQVTQVQARRTGGGFVTELELQVSGCLLAVKKRCFLSEIACREPLSGQQDIALRIYYAKAGEPLFDIAKRYHASPKALKCCNQLESAVLEEDTRILIPSAH